MKNIITLTVGKSKQKVVSGQTRWNTIDFDHKYREMIMAIKTKPFLILAGISGIGKSRFPRMLSYKCCTDRLKNVDGDPDNFLLLQVQPDWYDSSALLGYGTSNNSYVITSFVRFLVKAWKHPDIPFILCLDEMNIAHVEHYFATFLSVIESKRFVGNELISDAFITSQNILHYSKNDHTFWSRLEVSMYPRLQQQFLTRGITMPPNLIVIGTINTDESTQQVSKKVLDRAMTYEMTDIDMCVGLSYKSDDFQYPDQYLPADFLIGSMNDGYEAYHLNKENGDKILKALKALDFILADTKFRFGYRVRNEILIYCYFNSLLNHKPSDWLTKCIDEMILVKILPKLEGDLNKDDILANLLTCTSQFPSSHQKVLEIQSILTNKFGYSSFWKS